MTRRKRFHRHRKIGGRRTRNWRNYSNNTMNNTNNTSFNQNNDDSSNGSSSNHNNSEIPEVRLESFESSLEMSISPSHLTVNSTCTPDLNNLFECDDDEDESLDNSSDTSKTLQKTEENLFCETPTRKQNEDKTSYKTPYNNDYVLRTPRNSSVKTTRVQVPKFPIMKTPKTPKYSTADANFAKMLNDLDQSFSSPKFLNFKAISTPFAGNLNHCCQNNCGRNNCGQSKCGQNNSGPNNCGQNNCSQNNCVQNNCGQNNCGQYSGQNGANTSFIYDAKTPKCNEKKEVFNNTNNNFSKLNITNNTNGLNLNLEYQTAKDQKDQNNVHFKIDITNTSISGSLTPNNCSKSAKVRRLKNNNLSLNNSSKSLFKNHQTKPKSPIMVHSNNLHLNRSLNSSRRSIISNSGEMNLTKSENILNISRWRKNKFLRQTKKFYARFPTKWILGLVEICTWLGMTVRNGLTAAYKKLSAIHASKTNEDHSQDLLNNFEQPLDRVEPLEFGISQIHKEVAEIKDEIMQMKIQFQSELGNINKTLSKLFEQMEKCQNSKLPPSIPIPPPMMTGPPPPPPPPLPPLIAMTTSNNFKIKGSSKKTEGAKAKNENHRPVISLDDILNVKLRKTGQEKHIPLQRRVTQPLISKEALKQIKLRPTTTTSNFKTRTATSLSEGTNLTSSSTPGHNTSLQTSLTRILTTVDPNEGVQLQSREGTIRS